MQQIPILWVDASENTGRIPANVLGGLAFNSGGYRIGLLLQQDGQPDITQVHYNARCPDQYAGECYAVLKGIELVTGQIRTSFLRQEAVPGGMNESSFKQLVLRSDRITSFRDCIKKDYEGTKYLRRAEYLASEAIILVNFKTCLSEENLADAVLR
jgi:hypothetical protein